MAEETVVKDMLTDEMMRAGADLVTRLDSRHFILDAALWWYAPESNVWKLIVASPEVRSEGPKAAYRRVRNALAHGLGAVALDDVQIIDSDDPLVNLLRKAIRTGRTTSGIRFTKNVINGRFVEDAYIYRLA